MERDVWHAEEDGLADAQAAAFGVGVATVRTFSAFRRGLERWLLRPATVLEEWASFVADGSHHGVIRDTLGGIAGVPVVERGSPLGVDPSVAARGAYSHDIVSARAGAKGS